MNFYEARGQASVFLLLLYAGFGAAALYDAFRLLSKYLPSYLEAAVDLIWCLLTGTACALALSIGGEERARLYALLGLCCGAGIYCLGVRTLGRSVWLFFKKKR